MSVVRRGSHTAPTHGASHLPRQLLQGRYAAGGITSEEYEERRAKLLRGRQQLNAAGVAPRTLSAYVRGIEMPRRARTGRQPQKSFVLRTPPDPGAGGVQRCPLSWNAGLNCSDSRWIPVDTWAKIAVAVYLSRISKAFSVAEATPAVSCSLRPGSTGGSSEGHRLAKDLARNPTR